MSPNVGELLGQGFCHLLNFEGDMYGNFVAGIEEKLLATHYPIYVVYSLYQAIVIPTIFLDR